MDLDGLARTLARQCHERVGGIGSARLTPAGAACVAEDPIDMCFPRRAEPGRHRAPCALRCGTRHRGRSTRAPVASRATVVPTPCRLLPRRRALPGSDLEAP